jgi:hypothetical protein
MGSNFRGIKANAAAIRVAQEKIYLDATFTMAEREGFELMAIKRHKDGDKPVIYAKRIGNFWIEIRCEDNEDDTLPDAVEAAWEVEVIEDDSDDDEGERAVHVLYLSLQASDALRIAMSLAHFLHQQSFTPSYRGGSVGLALSGGTWNRWQSSSATSSLPN